MNLNEAEKKATRELGEAINRAVAESVRVAEAIENLRDLGYEADLTLKLEIGLREIQSADADEFPEEIEFDLTDDDRRTLRRMKIRLD